MWSLTSILRLDTLLGAAVLAYQTLLEWPWALFCFPAHEWCCIPPVRYNQTNCVHPKYNMIILVEIEPAECHSDPYWYSLSGGGDQILKVTLGGLTVCAQTHLMRPEVPAQCFNMDFVPTVVKTFQTIEVVPSGPFTGPEQWLVGAQCSKSAPYNIWLPGSYQCSADSQRVSHLQHIYKMILYWTKYQS